VLRAGGHGVDEFILEPASRSGVTARWPGNAVWNFQATAALAQKIEAFRPDVTHVHTPFPLLSPAVFRTSSRLGVPAVTTVHSYRYSCVVGTCLRDGSPCEDCIGKVVKLPGIRHRCYHDSLGASSALTLSLATHRLIGTFDRHVARFIALTEFAADMLVRDGMPADRVVVKPNSVPDPGPRVPRTGAFSFALFAGRLVEEKGIRTLLQAWRDVPPGVDLTIAGDGPLRQLVEDEARSNPAITYVGWVDDATMSHLLSAADLLVFPSEWYEAQPLIILQAFAAGTPIVCSDLENICRQVLKAGAGAAFETRRPAALAREVGALAGSLETLGAQGTAARAAYDALHTPARCLTALETIYSDVLSAPA